MSDELEAAVERLRAGAKGEIFEAPKDTTIFGDVRLLLADYDRLTAEVADLRAGRDRRPLSETRVTLPTVCEMCRWEQGFGAREPINHTCGKVTAPAVEESPYVVIVCRYCGHAPHGFGLVCWSARDCGCRAGGEG